MIPLEILLAARGAPFITEEFQPLNKSEYIDFADSDEVRKAVRGGMGLGQTDDYELSVYMKLLKMYPHFLDSHGIDAATVVPVDLYRPAKFRVSPANSIGFVSDGSAWPVFLPEGDRWPTPREYAFRMDAGGFVSITGEGVNERVPIVVGANGDVIVRWDMFSVKGQFAGRFTRDSTGTTSWRVHALPVRFPFDALVRSAGGTSSVESLMSRRNPEVWTRWLRMTSNVEKVAAVVSELIIQTHYDQTG